MLTSLLAGGRRHVLRSSLSASQPVATTLTTACACSPIRPSRPSSHTRPLTSLAPAFQPLHTSAPITNTRLTTATASAAPHRAFHNPSRVRGVGPRPDQNSRRTRQLQSERRRANLRAHLTGHVPVTTPVVPDLPALLTLPTSSDATEFQPAPVSLTVLVYSLSSPTDTTSPPTTTCQLPPLLFAAPLRLDILHRLVEWQRAGQRQGTAKTKDRGEVSGTGAKPHPQKGTGRARAGTRRAPHMRGGGVAHGKEPRDFGYALPKKVRALGLRVALTVKHAQGRVRVVDEATLANHKTRGMVDAMRRLGVAEFLLVHGAGELDANLALAARNLKHCDFIPAGGANVLSLLRHPTVLITRRAVDELVARVEKTMLRKSRVRYMVGSQGGGLSYEEWLAQGGGAKGAGVADAVAGGEVPPTEQQSVQQHA